MPLSKKEIENLMRLVGLTKDSEINCEDCLSVVSEFAERQLAGKSISAGLKAVEHHLSICEECREEYEALRQTLATVACTGRSYDQGPTEV